MQVARLVLLLTLTLRMPDFTSWNEVEVERGLLFCMSSTTGRTHENYRMPHDTARGAGLTTTWTTCAHGKAKSAATGRHAVQHWAYTLASFQRQQGSGLVNVRDAGCFPQRRTRPF